VVVVEGANVLHHVKRGENCPGGENVLGEYVQGNVRIPFAIPDTGGFLVFSVIGILSLFVTLFYFLELVVFLRSVVLFVCVKSKFSRRKKNIFVRHATGDFCMAMNTK